MSNDLKIKLGNFLYKHAYFVYKPMYKSFKTKQDAFEIELLNKYLKPGDTVIDIGSNIGFYATILSNLVGDKGSVHCFEPDVTNFKHLQKETAGVKNIVINNKAVSSKTETIKIYTSKELNVDHRTYKPEEYDSVLEIEAACLDDYTQEKKLKVDLIKMDIQGFEMEAIKGMTETLKANKNVNLISEFWPYGLNKANSSASEYFNYLISFGFNCYLLEKHSLSKLDISRVKKLEEFKEDKSHYFNIFATRSHV